ncbi:metallophosphoesterase family protein [Pontibacter harenae]|uniref:metallophosphoesterase family protein n=1 Tax=Pontibacter harenae TaxID=2894083 RepID=UPI001E3D24F3|nr:metallophosphoesterase family protein [Pontibacter harenae]MCC9165419.1 serine/threonine protein phosphatase [Pontibacter harenae]
MARYALTDIHGCARTLKAMVQDQLKLQKTDELYILGDLVNKGPDSKGVIDFILHLQKQDYQVFCLRGNHDQMLLKASQKGDSAIKLTAIEKKLLLENFEIVHLKELPKKYINFLKGLPYYLEVKDFFLVHAGFDFKQTDIFKDTDAMLNIRDYKINWDKLYNKGLLHGHTPTPLHTIKKATSHNEDRLNLDAGCVYYRNASFGNMVALNMDTYELLVQPNTDRPYPVARKS